MPMHFKEQIIAGLNRICDRRLVYEVDNLARGSPILPMSKILHLNCEATDLGTEEFALTIASKDNGHLCDKTLLELLDIVNWVNLASKWGLLTFGAYCLQYILSYSVSATSHNQKGSALHVCSTLLLSKVIFLSRS